MKKLFIFIFIVCIAAFAGCTTDKSNNSDISSTKQTFSAFNDEVYVWENFHTTTNRVQGVK